MSVYSTLCFLAASAIFMAFINAKVVKVQTTIAITAGALLLSLSIIVAGQLGWFHLEYVAAEQLAKIDFEHFLLQGVLGFLLFAGALNIKLPNLKDQQWEITTLALCATLISTFMVGGLTYIACKLIGLPLDFIYCLLFGALISPTDPIAVLAIVKKLNAPKRISTQIEGESLFNDGFGLVIFMTLFSIAFSGETPTATSISLLFVHEAIGGICYGLVLGILFHYLIRHTDDHVMELLLTFCVPTAGYVLASMIDVSGPLAMVVTGIILGNWTRESGFSPESHASLDHFWELVDELLNGMLFMLIGLVMLQFTFHVEDWSIMLAAIPIVLLSRYVSVKTCYLGFDRLRHYNPLSVRILTWGGLRGGLALAMAMSIPAGEMVIADKGIDVREVILVMTYAVVVFSILVQGSTITPLVLKAKQLESNAE